MRNFLLGVLSLIFVSACSSRGILKTEQGQFKDVQEEYSKVVSVEVIAEPTPTPTPLPGKKAVKKTVKKEPVKTVVMEKEVPPAKIKKHLPEIEDASGFNGRRPIEDPFVVGEEVTLAVKYFNMTAGDIQLSVLPYKIVNGKKSYHFKIQLKTNSSFSYFYTAENTAETFVDYEELVPHTLTIQNNESSRVVDSRSFFDHEKLLAKEWEKKVSKKHGEEKKEIEWEIKSYTQNIISALFYLRTFDYKVGKKYAFRVSDDGKNYVFSGEVLREETLDTVLGPMETIVIKPTFTLNNSFKPSGENYVWLTKDKYKRVVRVESKIKIGTLVAHLKSIKAPNQ